MNKEGEDEVGHVAEVLGMLNRKEYKLTIIKGMLDTYLLPQSSGNMEESHHHETILKMKKPCCGKSEGERNEDNIRKHK